MYVLQWKLHVHHSPFRSVLGGALSRLVNYYNLMMDESELLHHVIYRQPIASWSPGRSGHTAPLVVTVGNKLVQERLLSQLKMAVDLVSHHSESRKPATIIYAMVCSSSPCYLMYRCPCTSIRLYMYYRY